MGFSFKKKNDGVIIYCSLGIVYIITYILKPFGFFSFGRVLQQIKSTFSEKMPCQIRQAFCYVKQL